MRRTGPRRLEGALRAAVERAAPATGLARVQGCWREALGEQLAQEANPVAERDGTVTVECRSATWAQELELLSRDLIERLNGALAEQEGDARVQDLRFVVGASGSAPARPRNRSRRAFRRAP